jgi:hypothetical protein
MTLDTQLDDAFIQFMVTVNPECLHSFTSLTQASE